MAAPFCTACGATIAAGTRFCVKCGQPVGQAAPPPVAQTTVFMPPSVTPPPPPPPPVAQAQVWTPPPPVAPPPPPPLASQPIVSQPYVPPPQPMVPQPVPVREGPGAGLWIGIFGVLLLLGGAGLWFYTMHGPGAHPGSAVQVAAGPTGTTAAGPPTTAEPTGQPTPPQPTGVQATPDPSTATPMPAASTLVPAPTPNPTTEVVPPNPDFAKKGPRAQPAQTTPGAAPPASDPPSAQPARAARQTSGVLHAAVEVAQNGEVVFENLPGARLKFTFDHSAWQPTISHQANGTQTLVMRSLKPGIQTSCDVRWEIVP